MRRHLVAALAALVLFGTPALASVDEIQLHVEGLACPFCVYGIERSLKKIPGVVSVETTIRTGLVEVHLKPGAVVDSAQFQAAVRKSGFTLDHIEATITGKLFTQNDRSVLEATGSNQAFLLLENGREGTHEALSEETLKKLHEASEDGSLALTITGRVHGHVATQPALTVERFEVAG